MRTRARNPFTTVSTAGLLLPIDLLTRVVEGDPDLPGLSPKDYHLRGGERLNEAASRAWNECLAAWTSFRKKLDALPASDAGTTLTRDEWLLPLFQELGYGRLQTKKAIEIENREYPVSHGWENHIPIHLLSARLALDRRTPGVSGAATRAPYSLLQELLNRSAQHRWGFVSNGLKLFLLRDNAALARAANVEFDLEAMMEGEVYADFMLLFLLCHESRLEIPPDGKPENCWLEKWANQADQQGTRAREKLRDGVEAAIKSLGAGFLTTKGNNALRERLRSGDLSTQDYYRQLLRLVYRVLMLLVAEEKKTESGDNLFHPPGTSSAVRDRYARFYSVGRIRTLAYERRGTSHADLYESLKVLFVKLREGYEPLGIPGFGSFLFSATAMPDLDGTVLSNQDLLDAFRHLCYTEDTSGRGGGIRRPVDFGNLGSEELGSVYESLLELHPLIDSDEGPFTLGTAAGHERKTTGSYYTPTSLINCLLDSALDPVVAEAINVPDADEAEQALLNLKVCDPACGSGHFLIAAAERMATHLARLRTGDDEPNTLDIQHAKRDIIGQCIYGVDVNSMAVELCKVSLWMEALEPGKPLSFLDHHIQCGNSLLGTTPKLIADGIPDDAFKPIEGDDKTVCAELKKDNKRERKDYAAGYRDFHFTYDLGNLPAEFAKLTGTTDESVADAETKAHRYAELVKGAAYQNARLLADAWCASFVWKKDKSDLGKLCPTERGFRNLQSSPHGALPQVKREVIRLRDKYQFFHWHLAYPDVFRLPDADESPENKITGWHGGFSVLLGNPPWERLKFQEKEWFAIHEPSIAAMASAGTRTKAIAELEHSDAELAAAYREAVRDAEAENWLVRQSGRFTLVTGGDINTYAVFTETCIDMVAHNGRVGVVVPSAITSTLAYQPYVSAIVEAGRLASCLDFENKKAYFSEVHSSYRFCLLTVCGTAGEAAKCGFLLHTMQDVQDETRTFPLLPSDLTLLNPNTKAFPVFQSRRDASLVRHVHRRIPVLVDEQTEQNPWGVNIYRMIDANESGAHLRDDIAIREVGLCPDAGYVIHDGEHVWLRVYEGKMIDSFNHRFASSFTEAGGQRTGKAMATTLHQLEDGEFSVNSRYWIERSTADQKMSTWGRDWILAFMDVCSSTNVRTMIASLIPFAGATKSLRILRESSQSAPLLGVFLGNLNSFVFDYVTRQSVSGLHLSEHIVKQLPVLAPDRYAPSEVRFTLCRVLELSFTATDLKGFAKDCGYDGPPFRWDEERRFLLRCEIDAAYFHLYLGSGEQWGVDNPQLNDMFPTPRDAVDYIMDAFPIVRRKDEQAHGEYRTKRVILEMYDLMAEATRTGQAYQTWLDPPPADPRVAHPPRVDRERVERGRVVLDVLLLLEAWNQPVSITALEPALVLMRNDTARQTLLSRRTADQQTTALSGAPRFVAGLETVYQGLETSGAVRRVGEHGYELARPELVAEASQSDRDRAAEVIQAIKTLSDLRSLPNVVAELTNERYQVTI